MRQSIHSGIGNLFCWQTLHQCRIYDRYIWCDLKVSKGILDSLGIVCDHRKCRYFRRCTGSRRNRAEACLRPEFWKIKGCAQILKSGIRVLIKCPHCLSRINRGTSSDRNNPVRLKLFHCLSAFHNSLHRWVRLYTLKKPDFHPRFF